MKYTYKQTVQKIVNDQNECLPFKMESGAAEPIYSVQFLVNWKSVANVLLKIIDK